MFLLYFVFVAISLMFEYGHLTCPFWSVVTENQKVNHSNKYTPIQQQQASKHFVFPTAHVNRTYSREQPNQTKMNVKISYICNEVQKYENEIEKRETSADHKAALCRNISMRMNMHSFVEMWNIRKHFFNPRLQFLNAFKIINNKINEFDEIIYNNQNSKKTNFKCSFRK